VGVAYTHPVIGFQTVYLGFGLGDMHEHWDPLGPPSAIEDRTNLVANIMDYLGVSPNGIGTGLPESSAANRLTQAYPNPFNPETTIDYAVRESGDVAIRIYNVAGKLVRTLLEEERAAGDEGKVVWDGRDGTGQPCPSGVYFYRIETPGWVGARKLVLLK